MKTTKILIAPIIAFALFISITAVAVTLAEESGQTQQIIKITAKKFEYNPNVITIKKGIPVIFEFTSLDRVHGFTVPDLGGVRLTIEPGKVNRVTILAPKAGTYEFHCDLFCGDGHEGMTGKIIVEE